MPVWIIPGADYNEAELGDVEVPIFWDEDAQAFVNALTIQRDLATQKAINNYVVAVKMQGIWPRMGQFSIPMLGSVDGFINLKDRTHFLPPGDGIATYDVNGATFLQGWLSSFSIPTKADMHAGFFMVKGIVPIDDLTRMGLSFGSSELQIGRQISNGKNSGALWTSSLARNVIPNKINSAGGIIASSKASTQKTSCCVDGEISTTAQSYSLSGTNVPLIVGARTAGSTTTLLFGPIAAITIGSSLSDAEMIAYEAITMIFLRALLAAA